jgi:hypothetical protein
VRVRFPSPAPQAKTQVTAGIGRPPTGPISVPLARRDQDPGRAVVIAVVFALLALDVGVDCVRNELVGAAGHVLVDHRGPLAVVSHPGHQVSKRGAALRRELVPGVPEVVEVQPRHVDGRDGMRPGGHLVEVTPLTESPGHKT